MYLCFFFFFQAEDGIRDGTVTGVQTCALPIFTRMGARIETTQGRAPLIVDGAGDLRGIEYALPVASAQVKSAVLLAALNADGATTVIEPVPTRDHTELMLEAAGARVRRRPASVSVEPAGSLRLGEVVVPGDFSAAAPFLVAATLLAGSELTIHDDRKSTRLNSSHSSISYAVF